LSKTGLEPSFNGNMPRVTVSGMVDKLVRLYTGVEARGGTFGDLFPPMLWGPPGIGKSQGIRAFCQKLEQTTGRKVLFHEIFLNLCDPSKVEGIAIVAPGKDEVIFVAPDYVRRMDASPEVINVLKLGELCQAVGAIQNLAAPILLDRRVGEFLLPDNCIVMADSNRITDRCSTYKMPLNVANRLMHQEVESDFDGWKRWAVNHHIHPAIVGFLSWQPNLLMGFDSTQANLAFPTNRSWAAASQVLDSFGGNVEEAFEFIAGCVGMGAAVEFRRYAKIYNKLPTMEDIFQGRAAKVPTSPDALYGVVSGMVAYAVREDVRLNTAKLANSVRYAMKLPPDFGAVLLHDYLAVEQLTTPLFSIPEFLLWMKKNGAYYDGP